MVTVEWGKVCKLGHQLKVYVSSPNNIRMSSTDAKLPMEGVADKIETPSETSHPTDMEPGTMKDLGSDEAILEEIGFLFRLRCRGRDVIR
jgi:hypothetical protein